MTAYPRYRLKEGCNLFMAALAGRKEKLLIEYISDPATPGVQMPASGMLPEGDVRAIAEWLESLK